jgi:hypothetical protein
MKKRIRGPIGQTKHRTRQRSLICPGGESHACHCQSTDTSAAADRWLPNWRSGPGRGGAEYLLPAFAWLAGGLGAHTAHECHRAVPGFCVGVCGSRRSVASAVHTTAEKSWRFAVPQLATLPSRHCIGVFFSRVRVISKSKATVQVRGRTYGALSCSCATETSP